MPKCTDVHTLYMCDLILCKNHTTETTIFLTKLLILLWTEYLCHPPHTHMLKP